MSRKATDYTILVATFTVFMAVFINGEDKTNLLIALFINTVAVLLVSIRQTIEEKKEND